MKKIAMALVPAISMLGACDTESPAPADTTERSAVESTLSDREISELAFVSVIRDYNLGAAMTDKEIVALGDLVCENIDLTGIEVTALTMIDSGGTPEDAGIVLGAAVTAFCPEYNSDLERMIGEMV